MRSPLIATLLLTSSLAFAAAPALAQDNVDVSTEIAQVAGLGPVPAGKLSDAVVPSAYSIDMYVDPDAESYSGSTAISVTIAKPTSYIDLHGLDLTMKSASAVIGGKSYPGKWTQLDDTGVGRLVFDQQLPAGAAVLNFTYEHPFNRGPAGLFKVKVGDQWFAWSQFESIDARQAFPSFDEPGFKVPFSLTLRTRPGQKAVTNTSEVSTSQEGDWVVHKFATTKPLPTYLIAIMVGPFAMAEGTIPATPERPTPLPLRIVTTPNNADKFDFALAGTEKIIPLLEKYFGRSYPYDKLDQISTPILPGAMENAGAVLYGDSLLMVGKNPSVGQQRNFGMVISHELGHQWFGDLVTPKWWDDIWLNESFANWIGYRIADEWRPDLKVWGGALGEGFDAMNTDALIVGRPIRQPIKTNGEIDGAFDSITYGKGGHVIAMIAAFMGDAKFQAGVRQHLANHAYGNATGDDFFAALAKAAGDPRIVAAMKSFVEQQGVPLVTVSGSNGDYTVTQQRYALLGSTPPDTTWGIPLCMRRADTRDCKLFDGKSMSFKLAGTGALLPNAGGTGYYRFDLPKAGWDELIATGDKLEGGEAQAVADSLRASFEAGRASPEQLIALARKLAVNPDSYASGEAGGVLGMLNFGDNLEGDAKAAFEQLYGRVFAPQLEQLGFDPKQGAYENSDTDSRQRRQQLVSRLAFVAKDKAVRATLEKAAEAYLGGDETALDPSYLGNALRVYVSDGDEARVKDLAERALASQDPIFRPAALGALPTLGTAENATWLLEGLQDERLRPTERLRLLAGVISEDKTREFGIDWLSSHYKDLISGQGGIFVTRSLPYLLSGVCSAERADQFASEFGPAFKGTPGELTLDRTLEGIRSCDTLKQARGAEVKAAVMNAE